MTTVVRWRGFRVCVYPPPREHGPPHAHVLKSGVVVLVALKPVSLKEVRGNLSSADVATAVELVEANVDAILAKWRILHG
jgi:hypothetical protein